MMTRKKRTYSWRKIDTGWVTEEQLDGVPDWWVFSNAGEWYAKGRTSGLYSGPFASRTEAITHAETC